MIFLDAGSTYQLTKFQTYAKIVLLVGNDAADNQGYVMKKLSDSGSVQEYQGEPVNPPIEYTFEYEVYENLAEARQSEDWPGDSEILKFVNQRRFTSAKAQAYQNATKPLKKAYEESPAFKRKNLVASAVAAGLNQQDAEAMAESIMARGKK